VANRRLSSQVSPGGSVPRRLFGGLLI